MRANGDGCDGTTTCVWAVSLCVANTAQKFGREFIFAPDYVHCIVCVCVRERTRTHKQTRSDLLSI